MDDGKEAPPSGAKGGHIGAVAFAAILLPLLCGCSNASILDPAGPVAEGNRTILLNAFTIMMLIIVPTMIAIIAFAWWFRAGNTRARYRPEFVYSGRVELVVWSIPILVILFLGGVIWIGSHDLDPHRPIDAHRQPLEVQVVSLDWKWLFIYPQQRIATVNQLVLPVGVPVRFRLTSASVMNVFFVPRLGSMIYTMNGMETALHLRADRPGSYYGQSAHYSGQGFSDMRFAVRALPPAEFARWAGDAERAEAMLDRRTYAALAQQSRGMNPIRFTSVEPGLFEAIIRQEIPPAPGPTEGRGGPSLSPETKR